MLYNTYVSKFQLNFLLDGNKAKKYKRPTMKKKTIKNILIYDTLLEEELIRGKNVIF